MSRLKSLFITTLVFLSLSTLPIQLNAAKFFKWTDENGNIHYSDKAPDNVESAETVHVSSKKRTSNDTDKEEPETQLRDDTPQRESTTPEDLAKEKEKQEKALAEYCQSIQSNIKSLQIGGRIQTVDPEGNKKFLDQEEQQQKLNEYLKEQKENCN